MKDLIEIIFTDVWHFFGTLALLFPISVTITSILNNLTDFIFDIWSSFMRMLMVRKHGWPTNPDLDANGNFKSINENK